MVFDSIGLDIPTVFCATGDKTFTYVRYNFQNNLNNALRKNVHFLHFKSVYFYIDLKTFISAAKTQSTILKNF